MTPLDTSEQQNSSADGQDFAGISNISLIGAPGSPAPDNNGSGGKQPKRAAAPSSPSGNQGARQAVVQDDPPPLSQEDVDAIEEFCRKVMYNWCIEDRKEIDNERLIKLHQLALLGTYNNVDGGFEIKLPKANEDDKERTVRWSYKPPGPNGEPAEEYIVGKHRGFSETDADAIVALSAVRGWGPLNVHGSKQEKELLWLAAMDQGLGVANFTPEPDSDVWEKLKQREAAKKARIPGASPADANAGPSVSASGAGSSPQPAPAQPEASQPTPSQFIPPVDAAPLTGTKTPARSQFIPSETNFREYLKLFGPDLVKKLNIPKPDAAAAAKAGMPQETGTPSGQTGDGGRHRAPEGTKRSSDQEFIARNMEDPTPRPPLGPKYKPQRSKAQPSP